jgi:hypothetical protein
MNPRIPQFTGDRNGDTHVPFLDIIVLNSFLCTAHGTKMTQTFLHAELDLKLECGVSTGDVKVSESQNISLSIHFAKFPTAHKHINTQRPVYDCKG